VNHSHCEILSSYYVQYVDVEYNFIFRFGLSGFFAQSFIFSYAGDKLSLAGKAGTMPGIKKWIG